MVIDEQDKRLFDKRLNNDLSATLEVLSPFRESLHSVAVESTFNWYWLVDGLQEAGFKVQLVNTAAVGQYDGLKYSGDHQDAFHLAHLMRLGILPTGYIYPKAQRAVRDLLRRRLSLVRAASTQLISVQSQIWRSTGSGLTRGAPQDRLCCSRTGPLHTTGRCRRIGHLPSPATANQRPGEVCA